MSEESNEPSSPSIPADAMRVSDAERNAMVDRLNEACSEGRITLEEFSERVEKATSARTRGDLDALAGDLPATSANGAVAPAVGDAPAAKTGRTEWHVMPIGGMSRRGPWRMRSRTTAVTLIGGVDLDLRKAEIPANEVLVTHVALIGGMDVTVPPGVTVVTEGFHLIGGRRVDAQEAPGPGSPTVRLRSFSVIGGTRVRTSRPIWKKFGS